MTPQASAAPVHRNENEMPNRLLSRGAYGSLPSERQKQQVARYDRRQNERQVQDAVENELAGKAPSRQRVGGKNGERQGDKRRHRRNPKTEQYRRPLVCGESEQRCVSGFDAAPSGSALFQDAEPLLCKGGLAFR